MKINVRKNVFETNSSSSHSIHIDRSTRLFDTSLLPDKHGHITLRGGQFGWEWKRYNDAKTKANYMAINGSGLNNKLLTTAIKEFTGANHVLYSLGDSYIDHQSTSLFSEFKTTKEVIHFIFNPNCWLITGNDNSDSPGYIYEFPHVTPKGTFPPLYRWMVFIPDSDISKKFKYKPTIKEIGSAISDLLYSYSADENGKIINSNSKNKTKPYYDLISGMFCRITPNPHHNSNYCISRDSNGLYMIGFNEKLFRDDLLSMGINFQWHGDKAEMHLKAAKSLYKLQPEKYTCKIRIQLIRL